MNTNEWIERLLVDRDLTVNSLAKAAGIVQSTLNRQIQRGDVDADMVIILARSQGLDPVTALYECGFLTDADIRDEMKPVLEKATDMELARELLRRASMGNPNMGKPLTEVAFPDN